MVHYIKKKNEKRDTVLHYIYGLGGGGAERIIVQLLEQNPNSKFNNFLLLKQELNIAYDISEIQDRVLSSKHIRRTGFQRFSIIWLLFFYRRFFPWKYKKWTTKMIMKFWMRKFIRAYPEYNPRVNPESRWFTNQLWIHMNREFNGIINLANSVSLKRPDLISSTLLESANSTVFFAKLFFPKTFKDVKWVASIHNNTTARLHDIYEPDLVKFWRVLLPLILNKTDKTVAVSEGARNDLIESFRVMDSKVVTILNPVDIGSIDRATPTNYSSPFFMAVGRLSSQKRFDMLIEAFAAIADQVDEELLIFGQGELENELKKKCVQLDLTERVKFMGFRSDVWSFMKSATCLVMTSLYEGLPMTLLEAKACKCPIVSFDCNYGPSELIKDDFSGYLVPMDDTETLQRILIQVSKNPSERKQMAESGYKEIESFSICHVHKKYESMFHEVLST